MFLWFAEDPAGGGARCSIHSVGECCCGESKLGPITSLAARPLATTGARYRCPAAPARIPLSGGAAANLALAYRLWLLATRNRGTSPRSWPRKDFRCGAVASLAPSRGLVSVPLPDSVSRIRSEFMSGNEWSSHSDCGRHYCARAGSNGQPVAPAL